MALDKNDIVIGLQPTADLVRIQGYNITVQLTPSELSTPERGERLLNAEKKLRTLVDHRIHVFLEPKGDLNKLRILLRGVKV